MHQQRFLICSEPPLNPVQLYQCPICKRFALTSEDPLDNSWVCLGEAVCSKECYEKGYELMREKQNEIPFYHTQPLRDSSSSESILSPCSLW